MKDYVNIDNSSSLDDVTVGDVLDLSFIKDDTVDEVVAFYLLEHLTYEEVTTLLYQISKKLIAKGKLRILVPDFEAISSFYLRHYDNVERLKLLSTEVFIFGQEGGHKSLWNKKLLLHYLTLEGYFGTPTDMKENVGSRGLGLYMEVTRTLEGKYYRQILKDQGTA